MYLTNLVKSLFSDPTFWMRFISGRPKCLNQIKFQHTWFRLFTNTIQLVSEREEVRDGNKIYVGMGGIDRCQNGDGEV